jgi:hypothetical protein
LDICEKKSGQTTNSLTWIEFEKSMGSMGRLTLRSGNSTAAAACQAVIVMRFIVLLRFVILIVLLLSFVAAHFTWLFSLLRICDYNVVFPSCFLSPPAKQL